MDIRQLEEILDRFVEGTCSPEEEAWIEQWLEQNPLNPDSEWKRMSAEDKQGLVADMYTYIRQEVLPEEISPPAAIIPILRKLLYTASVAAVLAGVYFLWPTLKNEIVPSSVVDIIWSTIDVPPGHQTQVRLTDGTKIWLHGGSQLRYPQSFQDLTERSVTITGEGYFEVAHDPEKVFVVRTPALEARVLGTSFNVQAYPQMDAELISLTEGRLQVTLLSGMETAQSIILQPQEAVRYQVQDSMMTKRASADHQSQDYKKGLLEFDNTPLAQVLYRIERTYAVQVKYDHHRATNTKITGTFYATEPVKDVLKSIARSIKAELQWTSSKQAIMTFKE